MSMYAGNPIEPMSEALYRALLQDLPEIEYRHQTPQQRRDNIEGTLKKRRPRTDEVEVYCFPQTWGSTALGFGGIGGAAMTSAYTTVVVCQHTGYASVYFNGGHAYTKKATSELMKDVMQARMAEVSYSSKYGK